MTVFKDCFISFISGDVDLVELASVAPMSGLLLLTVRLLELPQLLSVVILAMIIIYGEVGHENEDSLLVVRAVGHYY